MSVQQTQQYAWKFIEPSHRLRFGHGGLVKPGAVLTTEGPLSLCTRGIHFCRRAIDALEYAPDAHVALVRPGGDVLEPPDENKGCSTSIEVVAVANATMTLHEFALWCARGALEAERKAGREPDTRCWQALEVKAKWLIGEATDEELDAAESAARSAAWSAARSAAWSAQNRDLERRLYALLGIDAPEVEEVQP